jgi:putative copper resistance protein D
VLAAITWPPFGVALYVGVIVGTHLTGFMNLVETNGAVHDAEHALYLIAGYLYFLPLIGREPIRWKVSYPSRIFLLFIAMPVDAFTGLVLGSESRNPFPGLAENRPGWAPSPLTDVHIGGAVMWVGGAGIMFGLVMAVFFAWSREKRADAGLGWLEAARQVQLRHPGRLARGRERQRRARPGLDGISGISAAAQAPARDRETVDDDEHLAAYNAYLARINKPQDS